MAYSQFTYKRVHVELGIQEDNALLFPNAITIPPTAWLIETLKKVQTVALFSEKSRSEGIVFPILTEVRERNQQKIALYSGAIINADTEKGLNGECDFILSKGKQRFSVDSPLFCMIEAEDNDIEKNIPQCIAQMEGARIFNQNEGNAIDTIFGCVTTGTEWQFLKLENHVCWIDTERFYIKQPEQLLGIFQAIVDFYWG